MNSFFWIDKIFVLSVLEFSLSSMQLLTLCWNSNFHFFPLFFGNIESYSNTAALGNTRFKLTHIWRPWFVCFQFCPTNKMNWMSLSVSIINCNHKIGLENKAYLMYNFSFSSIMCVSGWSGVEWRSGVGGFAVALFLFLPDSKNTWRLCDLNLSVIW